VIGLSLLENSRVRYSFHGKVRANGQQVDGFVEAASATEAIDRLADRGIIGVYSVRPEPKLNKNAVRLSGEPEPEDEEPRRQQPRLPGRPSVVPKRIAAAPAVAAPPAPSQVTVSSPVTEAMLKQVLEKLNELSARVEQALARPTNVTYQSGAVRNSGGAYGATKKSSRIPLDVQSSTLHDIFKNNLDLRRSLDKLADAVGPAPVKAAGEGPDGAPANAPASGSRAAINAFEPGARDAGARDAARELPRPSREPAVGNGTKLVVQAQSA
jgi:hypothetical protein